MNFKDQGRCCLGYSFEKWHIVGIPKVNSHPSSYHPGLPEVKVSDSSAAGMLLMLTTCHNTPCLLCMLLCLNYFTTSQPVNTVSEKNIFFFVSILFSLQVFLNTYGIQTQTPQQVEPIQIWAQQELVKVSNAACLCFGLVIKNSGWT